jgi:hypothetical protein
MLILQHAFYVLCDCTVLFYVRSYVGSYDLWRLFRSYGLISYGPSRVKGAFLGVEHDFPISISRPQEKLLAKSRRIPSSRQLWLCAPSWRLARFPGRPALLNWWDVCSSPWDGQFAASGGQPCCPFTFNFTQLAPLIQDRLLLREPASPFYSCSSYYRTSKVTYDK